MRAFFFALKTKTHVLEKQRAALDDVRTSLQSDADLVLQMSGAVIATQLA
jgi:hypothetical protein